MSDPKVLTPSEVAEMLKRAEKATPGPWETDGADGRKNVGIESAEVVETDRPDHTVSSVHITAWKRDRRDARPTAASRTDLPALCRSHEKLREIIRGAQHTPGCGSLGDNKPPHAGVWIYYRLHMPELCDCFKAAAEGGQL